METYKMFKIYNQDDFRNITKGIQVAECNRIEEDVLPDFCDEVVANRLANLTVSDSLSCSCCNASFIDKNEQRKHFKLDWHRYNIKQKLAGLDVITEEEFSVTIDDLSSISGSESEEEDSLKSNNSDIPNELGASDSDPKLSISFLASRHSKVFFENEKNEIFSMYKCLLHNKKEIPQTDAKLINLAQNIVNFNVWAIFMLGGGHFAAAIFEGNSIIVHKTFHCYTVRAKQGGTQSSRDGRGGHPKSAGASLRRYNEQALTQHVQEILELWKNHLNRCHLLLYRAVGPQNRTVLFGGKNPPLDKTDPRLRTIPFVTRRATFKEIKRVHDILSSLEIYGNASLFKNTFPITPNKRETTNDSTDSRKNQLNLESPKIDDPKRKSRPSSRGNIIDRAKSRELVQRPLPGGAIDSSRESSSSGIRVLDFNDTEISFANNLKEFEYTVPEEIKNNIKKKRKKKTPTKKRSEAVETKKVNEELEIFKKKIWAALTLNDSKFLEKELQTIYDGIKNKSNEKISKLEFDMALNESIDSEKNTVLHVAAADGKKNLISIFLKFGSNPCNLNRKQQTPYTVALSKDCQIEFRKFLTEFPEKYDYKKSNIPGPLTAEFEKELAEKERLLAEIKVEKQKEKERERKEQEEKERFAKLSDREKRALAAERRLVNNTGAVLRRCFLCGVDITGKVPFEYNQNVFCSMPCLKTHRSQRAAFN